MADERPCFENVVVQFLHKYGFLLLAPGALLLGALSWWLIDLNGRMRDGEATIRLLQQGLASEKGAHEQIMLRLGRTDHALEIVEQRLYAYCMGTREKKSE